jgi:hypothetical protein
MDAKATFARGWVRHAAVVVVTLACVSGTMGQGNLPPVPTGLRAVVATEFMSPMPVVKLQWNAPAGVWGFQVYRSMGDSNSFAAIGQTNIAAYVDRPPQTGHRYYYYVTSLGQDPPGTTIESPPSTIAWVDLSTLPVGVSGTVAGVVTDDTTGKPIAAVRILFHRSPLESASSLFQAVTDSLGRYSMKVDTGVYRIKAEPAPWMPPGPPAYLPEWFDNKPEMASADPVNVGENATVEVNFGLRRGTVPVRPKGVIEGTVVDEGTGEVLPWALIRFYPKYAAIDLRAWQPLATTDSLGQYRAVLDTGTYLVKAEGVLRPWVFPGYIPEWFDNVQNVNQATPVRVTAASAFTADFALARMVISYASIRGTVTDTSGAPLRNATVVVMRTLQELGSAATFFTVPEVNQENVVIEGLGYCGGVVWKGRTDSLGQYTARVLSGKSYRAAASKEGYYPEYYNNTQDPLTADDIVVSGDVSGIDFSLAPRTLHHHSVSGSVRDSSGSGVPSLIVLFPVRSVASLPVVFRPTVRFGHTDTLGAYTIPDVVEGTYIILAVPYQGYAPAFYSEGAYGVMSWQKADRVSVSGEVTDIVVGVVPIHATGVVKLQGLVTTRGTPLAGVRVAATIVPNTVVGCGLTDATGRYVIEGCPAAAVVVSADRPEYREASRVVTVGAGQYEVGNIDFILEAQTTAGRAPEGNTPERFSLEQNYPNPFNPSTSIAVDLPEAAIVKLVVFNLLGEEIRVLTNGPASAGRLVVRWDATNSRGRAMASGVYLYRVTVADPGGRELYSSVRKMTLVR